MTPSLEAGALLARQAPVALRWLRALLVALAACAGSTQAAVYTGVWDPPFGAPFTSLAWHGRLEFTVYEPVPFGAAGTSFAAGTAALGRVTEAQVEFYDASDLGRTTVSTLVFDTSAMYIRALSFGQGGAFVGLKTDPSPFLKPGDDLRSPFNVSPSTEFSLFFTLKDHARMMWWDCGGDRDSCTGGFNDALNFPVTNFSITQVPEPGSLALACLGMMVLAPRLWRARAARRSEAASRPQAT